MSEIVLYNYWRSSASYRVRIALALKSIDYRTEEIDLAAQAHLSDDYACVNPQRLVPALAIDGKVLTQSLAIIQYLDDTRGGLSLIPTNPLEKQRVLALSYAIAMEIHPICNLSVADHVASLTNNVDEKKNWMQHFITRGLADFEQLLNDGHSGQFCYGNEPSLIDCCLIPQIYNAHRWEVEVESYPRIVTIAEHCSGLDEFITAHPDRFEENG